MTDSAIEAAARAAYLRGQKLLADYYPDASESAFPSWEELDEEGRQDEIKKAQACIAAYLEASCEAWTSVADRLPDPREHSRVLIYTDGHDFGGEQFFDVRADSLNECFYASPDDQPEVCRHASHWRAIPVIAAIDAMGEKG